MKKIVLPAAMLSLFAVAACDSGGPVEYDSGLDDGGQVYDDTPQDSSSSSRANNTPSSPSTNNTPPTYTQEKPKKPAAPKPKYPKGISVPNKKGFVKSPYAEYEGLVDVRGFPAGTLVKCPYTSKIFVVP